MKKKRCTKCGSRGPFYNQPTRPEGKGSWCKKCVAKQQRERRIYASGTIRKQRARRGLNSKIEVLTHYGKDGQLRCCWPGCSITDIDVLTLDHVNDDGADLRRKGQLAGRVFYNWLKLHGYIKGLQTLCWNHQWKKRIEALREQREAL